MDAASGQSWVREALVILGAAAVVIPVFHRLRVSPVLGFMLVGLLAGPSGLGALVPTVPWLRYVTMADAGHIAPVAEFGIVLLLFAIGLELSWERIVSLRRAVFGLGLAQVAACTVTVGGAAWGLGVAPGPAVLVGLALAMSSTAVAVQVLAEEGRINSAVGRATLAVLLFQDLAVVPIIFVTDLVSHDQGGAIPLLQALGKAALGLVLLVVVGRLVLRRLFRSVARTRSPELFMAACLLVVLATALAADEAGLSMDLGALVAGILLGETEYRRQVEVTLEPFKGLLLGVFLISIGLGFDLRLLLARPGTVLGLAVALVLGKGLIIAGLARLFGLRLPVGAQAGLLLAPGGEFSFVLLGIAGSAGVLGGGAVQAATVVAALTMGALPLLSKLGRAVWTGRAVRVPPELLPPEGSGGVDVVVAGFGRVGQTVAALLDVHKLRWVGLDSDPRVVSRARRAGHPVYYGDVTQGELLRRVGLDGAKALVVTVDDAGLVEAVVRAARHENATVPVVARARDAAHAAVLYGLGATDAVAETVEASLQLGEAVLVDVGVPMGRVIVSIHEKRAAFQADIKAHAPGADVRLRGQARLRGHSRVRPERPSDARFLRSGAHGRTGHSAPVLENARQPTIPNPL